jgi:hypothetical protein
LSSSQDYHSLTLGVQEGLLPSFCRNTGYKKGGREGGRKRKEGKLYKVYILEGLGMLTESESICDVTIAYEN